MVTRSPSLAPGSIERSRNRPMGQMTPYESRNGERLHVLRLKKESRLQQQVRSERGTPETSDVPCFYRYGWSSSIPAQNVAAVPQSLSNGLGMYLVSGSNANLQSVGQLSV
jgi:hypothetical protein